MSDKLPISTLRLNVALKSEWESLVRVVFDAMETPGAEIAQVAKVVAIHTGAPLDNLTRKMKAIAHLAGEGMDAETLIALGQHETLSRFYRRRAEDERGKRVLMRFQVLGAQRDACLHQIERRRQILGLGTVEQFWEYQLAQWMAETDEEIKHSAGIPK
jgi:hypothetical protein